MSSYGTIEHFLQILVIISGSATTLVDAQKDKTLWALDVLISLRKQKCGVITRVGVYIILMLTTSEQNSLFCAFGIKV